MSITELYLSLLSASKWGDYAVVGFAGYGVQAGPAHGRQMKGIGTQYCFYITEGLQTFLQPVLMHITHKPDKSTFVFMWQVMVVTLEHKEPKAMVLNTQSCSNYSWKTMSIFWFRGWRMSCMIIPSFFSWQATVLQLQKQMELPPKEWVGLQLFLNDFNWNLHSFKVQCGKLCPIMQVIKCRVTV